MIMIWDYDYDYDLGYYDYDPIPIIDLGLWKNVQSPASTCRRGLVSNLPSCLQHVEASQDSTGRVVCVHQGWQAKDLGEVWKIMENGLNQRIKQIESQEFHDFTILNIKWYQM